MDYIGRRFLDNVVYLDGNTFTDCIFDGCVMRYEGGEFTISGKTAMVGSNRFEFGPYQDALENFIAWLRKSSDVPIDIEDKSP